ncbi:MAG: Crp/Fnr family transcriptional regulator [Bacillota bacterium]|jgi:CRP-like cAMP-binding protein|nr:Crp/Fnr family transcriptional regulator [Bacillota bacterium]HOC06886.1 Crp/Fnr family transcriptional regulator [Bacillota bacterium]HPZ22520.1 Crp/Fnr family transcriptional regulator [Bacillota bacterium]HQD20348.1 Crp/Fnr family transcriptional regulator [Bacillota bacterium]
MGSLQYCEHCGNRLCIYRVPLFSSLSEENLHQIASYIQHRSFEKGELLISEGESTDSLVIIHQGVVKAFRYTAAGREQILYLFSEGDFFGEQYLFSNLKATYNVEALSPVKICLLTKSHLHKVLLTHPEVAIKLISELGKRIAQMENTFQSMGIRDVDARVATLLLDFAERYGREAPGGTLINLPISREGMANYLGIARETLSRKLSKFEDDGLIQSLDLKTIQVKDSDSLEDLAGLS